jgi:hypothetical protein
MPQQPDPPSSVAALRAGLARLLLVLCLLGVQWGAAAHAASHLAASHSGDPGEGGAHPVCMECLAFHPLDGGILPGAVPPVPPAQPVPVLPGPAWTPPEFPAAAANSRAPPFVL